MITPPAGHRDGALDFVAQLADVAGPAERVEEIERVGAQSHARLAQALARLAQEKRAQVRDLLAPIAQRRHVDADDAQAVEQILAELAVGDALLEIGVGRGHDADVDARGTRLADRQDFPLLEEAQQLRLHVDRQVADLVEEERAADRGAQRRRADRRPRR